MELLINNGANINIVNNYGYTPLTVASLSGDLEIVNLLISNGADINIHDNYGNTALIKAYIARDLQKMEFLINLGVVAFIKHLMNYDYPCKSGP